MATQDQIDQQFNEWFRKSFEAHMKERDAEIYRSLNELCDYIDKGFDNVEANLDIVAKCLGGKKGDTDNTIILRDVDATIATLRTEMRDEINMKFKTLRSALKKELAQSMAPSGTNVALLRRGE